MVHTRFVVAAGRLALAAVLIFHASPAQETGARTTGAADGEGGGISLVFAPEAPRVHVDESDPAQVWVRGADYKARFGPEGLTFIPFLGSQAPRNFPVTLDVTAVRCGTRALMLSPTPRAIRRGDSCVEIDRGAVRDTYHLRPLSVEQTFVFDAPPGTSDIEVTLTIATELTATLGSEGGVRFANALGGVDYGRATAIDATGRSVAVRTTLEGEHLRLTVPAHFVASANYPLTIDPLIVTFGGGTNMGSGIRQNRADVAHVGTFGGTYLVVYEEEYSATDHDVYARAFSSSGNALTGGYVDFTTNTWSKPRVASNRTTSQFLAVAERTASGVTTIWGRAVTFSMPSAVPTLTMSAQVAIQSFGSNGADPDVGGDPNPHTGPGNYCVTWWDAIAGELYYRIVRTDLSMLQGQWLDPGTAFVSHPSVSKSCGVGAQSDQEWIIVWQQRYSATDEDIYGSSVGVDGVLRTLAFLVDYSGASDTNPSVSSPTDRIDGTTRFLVTYERHNPGNIAQLPHQDLMGQLFAGTASLSGTVDLTTLLGANFAANQRNPAVDTDGCRFAVGYSQQSTGFSQDAVPYLATLHVENGVGLAVTSYPTITNVYTGPDERMQITSERSGGTFTARYMAVWDVEVTTNGSSGVNAALYEGRVDLAPTSYFNEALPGCGNLTLQASGVPHAYGTVTLTLSGIEGTPYLLLGTSVSPIPLCSGCLLGVDPTTALILQTDTFISTIPCSSALVGLAIGVQGIDIGGTGGCVGGTPFSLSNEIIVTLL